MTLYQQIMIQQAAIRQLEKSLAVAKSELTQLENSRVRCKHTFSLPTVGHEHEGGVCGLCGINQLHADTMSWEARTGRR